MVSQRAEVFYVSVLYLLQIQNKLEKKTCVAKVFFVANFHIVLYLKGMTSLERIKKDAYMFCIILI